MWEFSIDRLSFLSQVKTQSLAESHRWGSGVGRLKRRSCNKIWEWKKVLIRDATERMMLQIYC